MKNCSDLIIDYLENIGVEYVFMLSGGGAMYLFDALQRSKIKHICCHHEQAAAVAAQSYTMATGKLAVCLVTTGPGGTNALTAVGASYVDSTPVLFLSGQVKRSDFASFRNVRQYGAQENDIVSMAKPVTKYAVTVTDENDVLYQLEKAINVALDGRKGPVWLDVPLDIQSATPKEMRQFAPEEKTTADEASTACEDIISSLKTAKRPLFLIGHGVYASNAANEFRAFLQKLKVPVLCTWRACGTLDYNDELFFGSPGLQAPRYSNFILQSCDLLVVLGSRLDNMVTAFNEENFASSATRKIIVDIDENELKKLNMPDSVKYACNVKSVIKLLRDNADCFNVDYSEWISNCKSVKDKYNILNEKQPVDNKADLYKVASAVSELCDKDDCIVVSSTSRCNTAGYMAFRHSEGQRIISSMGYGSMGFALPSVVGAYFGSNAKRVICFEGDGSLQLNIQELQTIKHYNIPMKLFVFSNDGYSAISTMQNRNFEGRRIGCDCESGVTFPDLSKIARAYGFDFRRINNDCEINSVVKDIMVDNKAVICEIVGSIDFDEIPKAISFLNAENKRVSAALENLYPFLPQEEINDVIKKLKGE